MSIDLLPVISGAIGGAASAGVFKEPIKTISEWWFISFGHSISEQADKLRAKQELNVEKYAQDIANEISNINPENVQEPKLNIVGPTLDASKFYIDDDEMRKMFAKLLASSMDKTKDDIVHNAFVEIIKQLSPIDAKNLFNLNPKNFMPIVQVKSNDLNNEGFIILENNFFIFGVQNISSKTISASLENLKRLGLVDISYTSNLTDGDAKPYEEYEKDPLQIYKQQVNVLNLNKDLKSPRYSEPYIAKGIIGLTDFGKNFHSICIS